MRASAGSILPLLPRLRRYAAAVTGSSRAGDRYVELCLETLIQEPQRLAPHRGTAVQLFELLHDAIDACGLGNEAPAELEFDGSLGRAVGCLPNVDRRLLLLTLLEKFSLNRAAEILAMPKQEARHRFARTCVALRDVCVARILVIEDRKPLADGLADLISQSGHTVVGIATDTRSAAALARRRRPDLVLADLHRGMGGIGPVRAMLKGEDLPVVFLGGRPGALRWRGGAPVFVIDGPWDPRMVEDTIKRALFSRVTNDTAFSQAAGG
jgi:CheY-like chemotaxis protein